jgi:hypothetical protein
MMYCAYFRNSLMKIQAVIACPWVPPAYPPWKFLASLGWGGIPHSHSRSDIKCWKSNWYSAVLNILLIRIYDTIMGSLESSKSQEFKICMPYDRQNRTGDTYESYPPRPARLRGTPMWRLGRVGVLMQRGHCAELLGEGSTVRTNWIIPWRRGVDRRFLLMLLSCCIQLWL